MKFLSACILLMVGTNAFGQYYYNDVVANNQSNALYQVLKLNKIKEIKVASFDEQNKPIEDISIVQEFTPDYRKLSTHSSNAHKTANTFTAFYTNNKLQKTSTITTGIETKTEYTYDDAGKLQKISSSSVDTAFKTTATELHLWMYNANGKHVSMTKIKNNSDTTKIEFTSDENGNVVEERWKKHNSVLETYYYYYNDKNLLTDIVRFNSRAQKLLPDFLFEYDDQGKLKSLTQVPVGNSNYLVWKYHYNEKGLKTEEECENKQKQLIGKVVYSYQ